MAEDFTLPAFLQDCDVDTIHQRMMDMLPDDIDKTEAGFPWDFTRPTAVIASELLEYYIPETLKLMFPQWSSGEFLDYLANMARLARKAPNFASVTIEITGEPGTIIATGTVFATPATEEVESIEFATEEDYADYLKTAVEKSLYHLGTKTDSTENMLTLSTCTSSSEAGRFIVQAMQIQRTAKE